MSKQQRVGVGHEEKASDGQKTHQDGAEVGDSAVGARLCGAMQVHTLVIMSLKMNAIRMTRRACWHVSLKLGCW